MSLVLGEINILKKDTTIYEGGDEISSIAYIISGRVLKMSEIDEEVIESGNFIGISDLYAGFYNCEYSAYEDCELLVFEAESMESLVRFLENNVELHAQYTEITFKLLTALYVQYSSLYEDILDIYNNVVTTYGRYKSCCYSTDSEPEFFLMPHEATLFDFSAQSFAKNYNVFVELSKEPQKLQNTFKANPAQFLKLYIEVLKGISVTYEDMVFYLHTNISLFASQSQDCLFCIISKLAEHAPKEVYDDIMELLTNMKQVISDIDYNIKQHTGITLDIDYNRVNFYFMMAKDASSNSSTKKTIKKAVTINDTSDLSNTLHKLCVFAGFDEERENYIDGMLHFFTNISDKNSHDDEFRIFRKNLLEVYIELYENVFLNYAKGNDHDKVVELFLDFGLLDERLLTDTQLDVLVSIPKLSKEACEKCNVYRMSDWLMKIYNGEENPSKNEFDVDYTDSIRERKRQEHLTPAQESQLLNSATDRVCYEIRNALKYNLRLLNGNILAFYPMLYMECFEREISQIILTTDIINNAISDCLDIDYSAFYREQLYENRDIGINRAVIQLEVFPNIVLFPIYGVNGIMWQEITDKRSYNPSRFFLPAFLNKNIGDLMILLIGRFRWELCKTMNGSSWNNILIPSLTSEFCDYIQFYRKNNELTSEKKEALKTQITRCRNNSREVFVTDYFIWIKHESAGAIRLNKVTRKILSTYCPFSNMYRGKLTGQPIFDDAYKRYTVEKQKKIRECAVIIRNLENSGKEIPPEILKTSAFYNNL